jgi:predicted nucleic acid-binding protein
MHVVLDSTALIADFHLNSSPMRSLLDASQTKNLNVVVPELVLLEVANKWTSNVDELTEKVRGVSKAARRLGLTMGSAELWLHGSAPETYEGKLRAILAEHAVAIGGIPAVPHGYFVRKAVKRQAPFNDKGAGYRDALIWETVKEILRTTSEDVVFVSKNSADFGSSERDGIKQSLVDELAGEGIEPNRLRILETTSGAAAATLDQAQDLLKRFEERLKSDDEFKERLFEELIDSADLTLTGGFDRSCGGAWRFLEVHDVNPLSYFKSIRSWPVSDGRIGVEFEAEADVDVDLEYEEEEGLFPFDFQHQRSPRLFHRLGTANVTALFGGELEYDARTASFSAVAMWIARLSEPDLSRL